MTNYDYACDFKKHSFCVHSSEDNIEIRDEDDFFSMYVNRVYAETLAEAETIIQSLLEDDIYYGFLVIREIGGESLAIYYEGKRFVPEVTK